MTRPLVDRLALCNTVSVSANLLSFVGRAGELAELRAGLEAAGVGRGGLWLLRGEPGIGKSRLIEEVAAEAAGQGFAVHWGRCWEAGGTPAYWPWVQVLRQIVRDVPPPPNATALAQLLPELRDPSRPEREPPPLSPKQARFQLLDAVAETLGAAARETPRLVLLEDLHVADTSTIVLLDFLSHVVRAAPIVVIGSFRDAEAHGGEVGALLHQVARQARTITLGPLRREDVAGFLARALEADGDAELGEVVYSRTEGNPLFMVELARLLAASGRASADQAQAVPPTVRTAIREHLGRVDATTAELLSLAAVLGRDLDADRLGQVFDRDSRQVAAALAAAERAHLVVAAGAGSYRFAHILIREVALAELADGERHRRHLEAAAALEQARAPWSEIANHYLAAGEEGRDGAIDALICAARDAMSQLAYDDAVASFRAALQAIAAGGAADPVRRCALLTELGGALFHAGDADAGRAACLGAAAEARAIGRADLLARAALELGSILRFAQIDSELVGVLDEARRTLEPTPSPLRARVLARLAAAMQPAADPSEPVARAREAIAMARECGDEEALLDALRLGCSAFVDVVPPAERIDANREHAALARRLGARADIYRAASRLALNCFELGDLAGAEAAIDELARVAATLEHPSYGWRVPAFEATRALWRGRFADAERNIARAAAMGAEAGDPSATPAAIYQRMRLYRLTGRDAELAALVPAIRGLFRGTATAEPVSEITAAAVLVELGRSHDLERVRAVAATAGLHSVDRTTLGSLAIIARGAGDRRLARTIIERLRAAEASFLCSGVIGMTWDEPVHYTLAVAWQVLGDHERALSHLDAGIDAARALGGAPVVAWLAEERARISARHGLGDRERARELIAEAIATARELGMSGLLARAEQVSRALEGHAPATTSTNVEASPSVVFAREGDVWLIRCGGRAVRVKHTKGFGFLARLVAEPGREFHVLDLMGAGDGDATIDLGDAGEHLDAEARAAYRHRVAALREELATAEDNRDLGRAEKARAELEFLAAELSRAVGLGNSDRRAGQAAERARVNVQRRIRDAIRRIAEHDDALARQLERSIKTGRFCSYEPS